jgi:hypothetical protein
MKQSKVLLVDAAINLVLGVLLVTYPPVIVAFLGVPTAAQRFYPAILGGVLFGIGIALLLEYFRTSEGMIGLGLGGAVAINLCGAIVLAGFLIFSREVVSARGQMFLWCLVIVLVAVSGMEVLSHRRNKGGGWQAPAARKARPHGHRKNTGQEMQVSAAWHPWGRR